MFNGKINHVFDNKQNSKRTQTIQLDNWKSKTQK